MSLFDHTQIRSQFPQLQRTIKGKPLIYLDSAATTLKPRCVIDAMSRFYAEDYGTVHRAVYSLSREATARYTAVRLQVKEWLHAEAPEEIVFTKGTTEGINLLAEVLAERVQEGDEVLVSEIEHHSNLIPWQVLCKKRKARLRLIPVDDNGTLLLDRYKEMLSDRTKIVSIAQVSNSLGTIHPVKEMADLAHQRGSLVVVDGAQAIAHMAVDVQELGADFYLFSAHKLFGPTGLGVLYGRKELLESLPPYQTGGAMVDKVSLEQLIFQPPPLRFEAGTPPIAEVIGLGAAISFIESIGREKIHRWEQQLLSQATEALSAIPSLRILGTSPNKGAIISFVVQPLHSLDIATLLDLKGVAVRSGHHCAQPAMHRFSIHSSVRASCALYTTPEEIHLFAESLKEVISLLSP